MTGLSIDQDGVSQVPGQPIRANVRVAGSPVGTFNLLVAPIPDITMAVPAPFVAAGPDPLGLPGEVYQVQVAYPSLWWFWPEDDNGVAEVPAPGFVGLSDDRDSNLLAVWLVDRLMENKPAIELALRRGGYFPDTTIKCITFGTSASIRDFPAILVTKPSWENPWVGLPLLREYTYRYQIFLFLFHDDRATFLPAGTQFAETCAEILNKIEYEHVDLASGTSLAFCGAAEGDVEEVQVDTAAFCTIGSATWSGRALKQGGMI